MNLRKNGMAALVVVCAGVFLVGCGSSPPTHYYALSTVSPASSPISFPSGVELQVDVVTIPPHLDRLQFVRRVDANQVDISGLERWAAPLDEQIRRVLSEDLAERSATGAVIGIQAAAPPPNLNHVAVDIDEFDGDASGNVTLRAHWAVVNDDHAEIRKTAAIMIPASGSDAGAVAAAMSTGLGSLADQIIVAAAESKR